MPQFPPIWTLSGLHWGCNDRQVSMGPSSGTVSPAFVPGTRGMRYLKGRYNDSPEGNLDSAVARRTTSDLASRANFLLDDFIDERDGASGSGEQQLARF